MNAFLKDDFLLRNPTAYRLYHECAKKMPIIDYHCHIDPKEIFEDRKFENITRLWLGGDHYKWRLMRANGIEERFITGDASDREKFQKFAETLPRAIGNPMVHWCHLELKNYFGYEGVLNGETAEEVWNLCNEKLSALSVRQLILQSNVAMIGTTDDPCSDLCWHQKLAESDFPVKVLPSFRPDPALNIHKDGFADYIQKLSASCGFEIKNFADLKKALTARMEFFATLGCRASDHGLDRIIFRTADDRVLDLLLTKAMAGEPIGTAEAEAFQTALLLHCGREYHRLGWVMQLHFSCIRNPNAKKFASLGPDTGFDCINTTDSCEPLHRLMSALDATDQLPKTVLYSLNPADNAWIGSLLGAYQGPEIAGKIQHGSAWWFNDHKTGMEEQMISLANLGILGNFIGMLTDSRSFLSYARHEYFRRILCNLIGQWVEDGEYPADEAALRILVADICYQNAAHYFGLED